MEIKEFLQCETPASWIEAAPANLPLLLVDHANCEKKAASSALNLMYRYVEYPGLLLRLSKLAREELRHFEQVLAVMRDRGIDYGQLSSSRYAGELREGVRHGEPDRLVDLLIVSGIIEARSCERFGALVGVLDDELSAFYASLLESESRHFRVYLDFALEVAGSSGIDARVEYFLARERALIETPDPDFRFHSGPPTGYRTT